MRSTAGAIAAHGALIHQDTDRCKRAVCRIYVYVRLVVKYTRQARRVDLSIWPMVLLFCETASGCSVGSSWYIIRVAGVVADMVLAPLFVFADRREKDRISLDVRTQSGLIWVTKFATYSVG